MYLILALKDEQNSADKKISFRIKPSGGFQPLKFPEFYGT